jgi:hypothetical protein
MVLSILILLLSSIHSSFQLEGITCNITFQVHTLSDQPSELNKSKYDLLWLNGVYLNGGGIRDILLSNSGTPFCYNGTHIVEDTSVYNEVVDFQGNFLLLQLPSDKTTAWERVLELGSFLSGTVIGNQWILNETSSHVEYYSNLHEAHSFAYWEGFMGMGVFTISCLPISNNNF